MTGVAGWCAIAASHDLPVGHVYQTQLEGRPLALWRSADGVVNIWDDRCPHRGVRFSIGTAQGGELVCQYHAWRFASGTGACTHIPAHPGQKPASAIRAKVWPAKEIGGLVWTDLSGGQSHLPVIPEGVVMRAMPVGRPADEVRAALVAADFVGAVFFVQGLSQDSSVIRGVARDQDTMLAFDAVLESLRHELEGDDHAAVHQ